MDLLEIKRLYDVSEIRFERSQTSFRKLIAEENRLRALLQELHDKEVLGKEALLEDTVIKQAGADVAWQSWVGRNRSILNMRLANVLARKEQALSQVRTAFGETNTLETLLLDGRKQAISKRNRTLNEQSLEQSVLQNIR